MVTLCVIDPETALTVTGIAVGGGAVCCAAGDEEEQPVIAAVATTSRRAKRDPPARIDRRFKPANASSPTGQMNAKVKPAVERSKWTG